ncbi:DNA repair protein REV1-like [Homalodisca vitripennis]|uniref:DNA repair protein REV1-like n=1 Tax=Homalodisca vitripennis TaxID=197043 RepID=UPI001EE9FFA9|nr:DNA repair protein REV1-like [Homalodisca vitripennis]
MPVADSRGKEENVSNSSALDQFFTARKHVPNRTRVKLQNPIKPAEIDKGVLEALPEDIRQEIMQEYGMEVEVLNEDNKKEPTKPVQYDCGVNISQIDLDVLEELPLEIKKEIQSTMNTNKRSTKKKMENDLAAISVDTGPKLDENLPPSEVRALIKAWTTSEDSPQACDVNMLTDYMQGLVNTRRLDSLDICISCLHRSLIFSIVLHTMRFMQKFVL